MKEELIGLGAMMMVALVCAYQDEWVRGMMWLVSALVEEAEKLSEFMQFTPILW